MVAEYMYIGLLVVIGCRRPIIKLLFRSVICFRFIDAFLESNLRRAANVKYSYVRVLVIIYGHGKKKRRFTFHSVRFTLLRSKYEYDGR